MKKFFTITLFMISFMIISCNSSQKKAEEQAKKEAAELAEARAQAIQDSIKNELAIIEADSIEQSKIKSYNVKMLSGKHKYGGSAKITYMSQQMLLAENEETAEKEMWTDDKKATRAKLIKEFDRGGRIRLDIERETIESANTEWFTIIIKDMEENEIYREKLSSSIPNVPIGNRYWWNLKTIGIEQRLNAPFYVYVTEVGADEPFKFEVTPVYK